MLLPFSTSAKDVYEGKMRLVDQPIPGRTQELGQTGMYTVKSTQIFGPVLLYVSKDVKVDAT
jgi:hypothetical protein